MMEVLWQIGDFLAQDRVLAVVRAVVIMLVALLILRLSRRRLRIEGLGGQHNLILRRLLTWAIMGLALAWALQEVGLDLRVVLGAAGVLTVAIGFAAQTSVSNLISGVFLMTERPFSVGDVIEVDGKTGTVMSIDSLSIKLRTFDNLLVRIPNETMLKANVTNLTHYAIRRYDMKVGVAYGTDLALVRELLVELAYREPLCLAEPAPLIILLDFADSAIQLQYSVWGTVENFLAMRNAMFEQVKETFDEHGIVIPFPQRTIHLAGQFSTPVQPATGED